MGLNLTIKINGFHGTYQANTKVPRHGLGGEHDMNIQEMQIAKPLFKSNAHRGCITGAGKVEFVG